MKMICYSLDFNDGRLYHFDLNKDRTELFSRGQPSSKIANSYDDILDQALAQFPGGIIDIQIGPDGHIYIVSLNAKHSNCDREFEGCLVHGGIKGTIFRIVPKN